MASMPIRRRAEGCFYECTTVNDVIDQERTITEVTMPSQAYAYEKVAIKTTANRGSKCAYSTTSV